MISNSKLYSTKNIRSANPLKALQNERGLVTIDFIFASILIGGFFAILFSIMLTLSVVEVTQYITYATARTFYAGHWDRTQQENLGEAKFNELIENETVSPFFNNGWFELEGGPGIQDWGDVYPSSRNASEDSANFIGSRIELNAKILEFRIPLIGDTSDLDDAFKANVASYLNREPTSQECLEFLNEQNRFEAIKRLDGSYRNSAIRDYVRVADNGC